MVQADPLRDYYQDLGVPPTCATDDIQKTFRKLALKYHPDRNPGCEDEYKAKFQVIQAAHEVLIDPERRFKYDLDRKKQTVRNRPAAPPRNAYSSFATAPSNYPPPPRRTPYGTQTPPRPPPPRPQASTASTAQNGANRFTNFPRPPPTAQRPNTREDADARRNVFDAWQRMNPGKTPPSAEDAAYARARANTAGHASTANTAKPGMGRSNTTKTPRKSGFDPATPGADEPQAHGSAYYTTSRHSNNPPQDTDSPQSTARKADPLRHFRAQTAYDGDVPFAEGRRDRTPYASMGGERTQFSSEGLGRSASTRSSPRQFPEADVPDPARSSRHRSVSPKPRRPPFRTSQTYSKAGPKYKPSGNATRPFFEAYDSSDGAEELFSTPPKAKATPPRRANGASQKKSPTGSQARQPNGTTAAHLGSGGNPTKMYAPFPYNLFRFNDLKDTAGGPATNSAAYSNDTADHAIPAQAKPAEALLTGFAKYANLARHSNGTADHAIPAKAKPAEARLTGFAKYADSSWMFPSSVLPKKTSPRFVPVVNSGHTSPPSQGNADPTRFNIPTADETFKSNFAGFKSRSAESINTTFSPSEWSGTFQGNPDYFAVPRGAAKNSKARQSPTRERPASRPHSVHRNSSQGPPPPPPPPPFFAPPQQASQMPPPPPPIHTKPPPGAAPVKFSPQEWQQTFKEPSWVYPTTSPSRPTSMSSKRPNLTKRKGSAAAKSATVTDANEEPTLNGTSRSRAQSVSSDSSNAMEIDTETPPTNGKRGREARTVPASPHRADWKDQAPKQPATAPTSATELKVPGLDGLAGLKNVAPFASTTDGGLRDLTDLGSTLPFKSAPSASHPIKPSTPEKLALPQSPLPPDEPAHLTKQSFSLYSQRMYTYISAWNKFNSDMINHFRGRQEWLENLHPAWLTAVGEPTGKLGFDSYMQAIAEDEQAMIHWNVGRDKYHKGMEACQKIRTRASRGLPDT